jgi:excisionase family DNA binding protein
MMDKLTYSVPEAAQVLGVGKSTVYQLLQRGKLRSVTVGKRRLVPRAAVLEYLGLPDLPASPEPSRSLASKPRGHLFKRRAEKGLTS